MVFNDPIHRLGEIEREIITNSLISVANKIRIIDDRKLFHMEKK